MIVLAVAVMILPVGQASPAPSPTATTGASPAAKRICRREAPLGSIMPHQTCHTRAEWAVIDGRNGDNWDTARRENAARNTVIPQTRY